MNKDPIKMLLEHAHVKLDNAGVRLGELLASEAMASKRLELLENYRKEYRDKFMSAAKEGIGPDAWRNYSSFLGKLDEAIAHQQQIVTQSKHQTALGQASWLHERSRMKAFDTLHQRQVSALGRRDQLREQKGNDDRSSSKKPEDMEE
ncbi:flagellar export protein FliJ [Viridibacterium curvum]|uniref:Flagellar FliJ protein n=1 Tax=Viridibacterium curvum TaxID=1101404 RepID=A0ABP9QYB6_9RHOO